KKVDSESYNTVHCGMPALQLCMPKRPMPPHREVVRLMNDLRQWCGQERGRQMELARILGVDRQRVSDWIAGRAYPSLGTGLQLYHFLKRERARARNPDRSTGKTPPPD